MKFLNMDNLPVNWFDLAVVGLLLVGILRGRKRGMSQEFLDVFKWLALVIACGFLYQPVGDMMPHSAVFGRLGAYVTAYVSIAIIVLSVFAILKRAMGGKLIGSDKFGNAEYPLGMASGMIRFACMIIAALALLNARSYTSDEVNAEMKFQNDNYGSQFFPTLQTIQAQVFKKSMSGSAIKEYLALILIKPTAPEKKDVRPEAALP
jgi:uncharacterized membrane protein required for colicin V production